MNQAKRLKVEEQDLPSESSSDNESSVLEDENTVLSVEFEGASISHSFCS